MKIEKNILEDRQAELMVEYTPEEFLGFKRQAAKKISKNAKIPGFRPGKAPYNVIVNHYGEGAIIQEALDIILDVDYPKILDKAEIKPSGVGNLDKIESTDPPKFIFKIPLEPEIDLGDYREIRKEYKPEEFDEKFVEDTIYKMRRNAASIVPSNHPATEGDLVYFNLSGEFLNPEEGEDATITDKTPQQVVITTMEEISDSEWPYPGFSRELIGVVAGDIKELQYTYPDDVDEEEYKGKTAIFTVEVQSVKALELPEVDEDFIQTLGDFKTPEDFRNSIEEHLRADHEDSYNQDYFEDILEQITQFSTINYPPQMLDHEMEHVLEDVKSRLESQNMDYETYLRLRDLEEDKYIDEVIKPQAKRRLERALIVDALVEAENLKLDQEKLKQHINDVMTEVYYAGNIDELQKKMGKEEFSRAISMEGITRARNTQIQERLKLIATGQPIPEEQAGDVETQEEDLEVAKSNQEKILDEHSETKNITESVEGIEVIPFETDDEEQIQLTNSSIDIVEE